MPVAPLPDNEAERLAALRSYDVLAGNRDDSLDAICHVVASIFHSPIALVSLSDSNRQVFKGRVGLDADELSRSLAPCAYAILGDEPLVVEDAARDARFADNPIVTGAPNVRFYAGAPLFTPDHYALGTLCAIDSRPQSPSAEQVASLQYLARTVMTMLDMRKAIARTRTFALTDSLTGLANRAGLLLELESVIERSTRDRTPFALISLDIDNFKVVNDTRGHSAGDVLLRHVAQALRTGVRTGDLPGRIGGDEFAILIPSCAADEAERLAHRILAQLRSLTAIVSYPVSVSIGVTPFAIAPAGIAEALELVDRSLYAAKRSGKNRVVCATEAVRA